MKRVFSGFVCKVWGPAAGLPQKQKLCALSRNSLGVYDMIVGIKYLQKDECRNLINQMHEAACSAQMPP